MRVNIDMIKNTALCIGFTILLAGAFCESATADPYKWCAVRGGSGSSSCYFLTIDQRRAAISGTSFCTENPFYDGRPVDPLGVSQTRRNRSGR